MARHGWLWRVLRRSAAAPEPPPAPDAGPAVGTVHAVLTPAGLVEVGGVVEPAVWTGPGDPPGRGASVSVAYDPEGDVWTASPRQREDVC